MAEKKFGYIAIDRSMFDHRLFRRRPEWLMAWQSLIAAAAWKPTGARLSGGIVDLERGQIATTLRALGKSWRWPKSSVSYFLKRLESEGMIKCSDVRTKSGTRCSPRYSHRATLITVCNYDKFQTKPNSRAKKVGQVLGQEVGQERQQAFGFAKASAPKHSNQSTKDKVDVGKGKEKGRDRSKPRHGAQGRGLIWCDFGTTEWDVYAADFKSVTGTDPLPQQREGGSGRWFKTLGEGHVPLSRATAVAQAALEQSHRERKRSA